ncbi:hypothetical protein ACFLV5_03850 [Chloroflexota bacterium]
MSQENKDKADAAEVRTHETRGFMQQVSAAIPAAVSAPVATPWE